MKKIAAILAMLVVHPIIASAADTPPAAEPPPAAKTEVGRVYVMSGEVTVDGKSGPVKSSEPIVPGMLVRTGENSVALLNFEDGLVVTMQSGSAFEVREYHYDPQQIENSKVDFALQEGGVRVVPGEIGRNKRLAFSLLTRNATIRGGAAEFAVVKAGNVVHGRVLAGEIRVTNAAGTASFKAGQSPVVPSSLRLASAFYPAASSDVFNEVLSLPVEPPAVIIEPVAAPTEALAAAPAAAATPPAPEAAPEPAPSTATAPVLVPVPVPAPALPAPEQGTGVMAEGPTPEATPEPVSVPSPEPAPADVPESVTAQLPESVSEPPLQPVEAPAPQSASVSATVSLPVQEAPSCTCNCTFSCK